jgi:LPXTG-site transpeptidase (sortase) family protein
MRIGVTLLAVYALMRVDAFASGGRDLAFFHDAEPDTALWSSSRIASYRASAAPPVDALAGALVIPSIDLAAPIYADASELNLNRGLGLIPRMAPPGASGNVGVAGHRDGRFRVLKDIEVGAQIELLTRDHVYRYRVTRITIVASEDASLLRQTAEPAITLVTCYPFYFVGHAPQRFVVRGVLVDSVRRNASGTAHSRRRET